jgi:hypothetical protein
MHEINKTSFIINAILSSASQRTNIGNHKMTTEVGTTTVVGWKMELHCKIAGDQQQVLLFQGWIQFYTTWCYLTYILLIEGSIQV